MEVPFRKSNGNLQNYNDNSYVFGDVKDLDNRDKLQANSALQNIDLINVPIFLAHARRDNRIPIRQSKKLYEAILNNSDLRIEYLELDGGHAISDMDVFDEYIEGVDGFLSEIFEH